MHPVVLRQLTRKVGECYTAWRMVSVPVVNSKRYVMIGRYVKEQLTDDRAHPPCCDGQVVCWV